MAEYKISDRYSATGTPRPDPATICEGQCEGMGCVPVYLDGETDPELARRWHEAETRQPSDDGCHFVVCPACEGTRLRPGVPVPAGWPPAVSTEGPVKPE